MTGIIFHHGMTDPEKEAFYRREIARIDRLNDALRNANQKLHNKIRDLNDSLSFVAASRAIIARQPCRYIDRMDFTYAELVIPKLNIKDTHKAIFYKWLSGWTYRDIAELYKTSGGWIGIIIKKTARLYWRNKDKILRTVEVNPNLLEITEDYRDRRVELINQIEEVLR